MEKVVTLQEAISHIHSGQTIMVGDFLGVGTPDSIISGILDAGIENLTMISCTTGWPDKGCGRLIVEKRIKRLITSHIGTNPETGRQLNESTLEVEFSPQGTLAERIRCGGAGLGGVLTPTGVNTVVEEGKQKIELDGKQYLLETALKADISIIKAYRADEKGNLVYRRTAQNYNPLCAMAGDIVIAEVEEIVPIGEIDPDSVMTPGELVTYVVKSAEVMA